MRVFIVSVAVLGVFMACSSKISSGSGAGGKYSEDLSVWRSQLPAPADTARKSPGTEEQQVRRDPARYVEARHAVNGSLDAVLDSIDRINLANGVVDGFTILLYSGTDREQALNVKKQVATTLPDYQADIQYVQPNFRVRSGKYLHRLSAHKDYMVLKRYFPNAIVIPERIWIR